MLRRWFKCVMGEALHITVQPDHILLTHVKRNVRKGFKQQIMRRQLLELDSADLLNQLNSLKNSLAKVLESDTWKDVIRYGIYTDIVLSNYFMRYAIIPWSADLAMESERQAFMRYRFNSLFGDLAKNWDLQMSEPEFGQPAIASGVDSRLLVALKETFNGRNVKIRTISPYLMLAINQTIRQIKREKMHASYWVAVLEAGRLCFGLIENDTWRLIKNVAAETDVSEQIYTLIQRETVNYNVQSTLPVAIHQAKSKKQFAIKIAGHAVIQILADDWKQQYDYSKQSTKLQKVRGLA